MATVFMRWLETSPQTYDRGIRLLTLGRLDRIFSLILDEYVNPGDRVLELGCGTGLLAAEMAHKGASVTAIDASASMLDEARDRLEETGLVERVELVHVDASQVADRFPSGSFDLVVASLLFSELSPETSEYVMEALVPLLADGGRILIADEIVPPKIGWRPFYYLLRGFLLFVTWLLTRTTTRPLKGIEPLARRVGLEPSLVAAYLGSSLALYQLIPATISTSTARSATETLPASVAGRLEYRPNLRSRLIDIWALFFRIIPPYPKQRTGLYAIGQPDAGSPVLVTGNFDLTVRRLVEALAGRVDAWLLVADSAGINVWCAAGGGYFTAEKIIATMKSARLEEVVDHRELILPQLCANGVDGWRLRRESGWEVLWGPVRAEDVPAYLASSRQKSRAMRLATFPLKQRLEMTTVTLGFYGLLIALPLAFLWPSVLWPVMASLIGLSYFYGVTHPWLPGRDGLFKSIPLATLALAGLAGYLALSGGQPAGQTFAWAVGLTGLALFTASEMQGMSPLMRGEQANWRWEAVIGLILLLLYWLVPSLAGWR